jgi:signal transduction histidine kinase
MQRDTAGFSRFLLDPSAFRSEEISFSLIMSFVAVLNRNSPLMRYPDVLWAFIAMLAFNLAYHLVLRRLAAEAVPLFSTAANITLISWILSCSGGFQSCFWPLYLLPVFTACLYLERRHVLLVLAATGAFLVYFYLEAIWNGLSWEGCEFLIKFGVLALAAGVTMPLAFKERAHHAALCAQRVEIEKLARESLADMMPGIAHNLNNPLTVILGSVELLLQEAPEGSPQRDDLERIQSAARACARLSSDLFDYSGSESDKAARALLGGELTAGRRP